MINKLIPSANIERKDTLIDIMLVVVVTGLAFGLAYHPYFFGDELNAYSMAIKYGSFSSIFQHLNEYKPRFVFNGILALLAEYQASRLVHAALVTGCMVWINVLLYGVVRYLFSSGRVLAWLLIATVLTSRYGTVLYFDYISGLVELLSTALLLSTLLLAWLAWREGFKLWYAACALVVAILCIFVHERYGAGLLAAGFAIAIAEWSGPSAKRRVAVVCWALSLGVIPTLLFWAANTAFGALPITTGTGGMLISLGWGTLWSALTYAYNVFLGGNYGLAWWWGTYNYLHPVGKIIGWATVACTAGFTAVVLFREGVAWRNRWLALVLVVVAAALIAVASLTGLDRQEARYMFPVGILVTMIWIVMLKGAWRHFAIAVILITNIIYLLSGSFGSIANVYASRRANSLATSLQSVMPNGRRAIVVSSKEDDDSWTIGDGVTFSKVNLKSGLQIDRFVAGRKLDPRRYDYGLIFAGFGPHNGTARYRLVSVDIALVMAGVLDANNLPVISVLGNGETWSAWQWDGQHDQVEGAVILRPGTVGRRAVAVSDLSGLNGRLLVYRARTKLDTRVPLRLQVSWYAKQDNRFLSTASQVVYPSKTWHSYATLLNAPPGADIGYVYATLQDGAQGVVELKSVELK
jgi:hypothetical protein